MVDRLALAVRIQSPISALTLRESVFELGTPRVDDVLKGFAIAHWVQPIRRGEVVFTELTDDLASTPVRSRKTIAHR